MAPHPNPIQYLFVPSPASTPRRLLTYQESVSTNRISSGMIAICKLTDAEVAKLEAIESDLFAGGASLMDRWDICCELRRAGAKVDEIRGAPLNVEGHTLEWSRCAWRFDGEPVISIDDILARL